MNSKEKGDIAESLALYRLLQEGYSVSDPWGDNDRYDFLCEKDGEVVRVQVKHGRVKGGKVVANTCSVNLRTQESESYEENADFIAIACPERDSVYLVSVEKAPKTEMRIRFENCKNNQTKGINFAKDYIIGE